jgi:hypothetical protein
MTITMATRLLNITNNIPLEFIKIGFSKSPVTLVIARTYMNIPKKKCHRSRNARPLLDPPGYQKIQNSAVHRFGVNFSSLLDPPGYQRSKI